jgi:hypothetical protein
MTARIGICLLLDEEFVAGPTRRHFDRTANRGMWADDASLAARRAHNGYIEHGGSS